MNAAHVQGLLAALRECERAMVALETTDELPRDTCPADLVHIIREALAVVDS